MKTMIFSVLDSKAAVFGTPFFMQREAAAIRAVGDAARDPENMLSKHPEDFSLYHIGDFDDEKAVIDVVKPRCLVTVVSLIKPDVMENFKENHVNEKALKTGLFGKIKEVLK